MLSYHTGHRSIIFVLTIRAIASEFRYLTTYAIILCELYYISYQTVPHMGLYYDTMAGLRMIEVDEKWS